VALKRPLGYLDRFVNKHLDRVSQDISRGPKQTLLIISPFLASPKFSFSQFD